MSLQSVIWNYYQMLQFVVCFNVARVATETNRKIEFKSLENSNLQWYKLRIILSFITHKCVNRWPVLADGGHNRDGNEDTNWFFQSINQLENFVSHKQSVPQEQGQKWDS